jgi:small-conductance mechanosensitive channel
MKRHLRSSFYWMGRFGLVLITALLFLVVFNPTTSAQAAEEAVEEQQEVKPEIDAAPVTVDGEDLFMVVGVTADPAEERAAEIARRIVEAAEKGRGTPNIRVQASEFGPAIFIDGLYITTVTQVDAEYESLDAPTLAKRIGERIKDEILAYRERRSESGITESVIAAVSWTAVFLVFSVMLWFALRYLLRRADRRIVSWVQRVESRTGKIAKTDTIVSTTRVTLWAVAFFLFVIVLYYYLSQVLYSFPATRGFAAILLEYFTGPILGIALTIGSEIPDLLMLVVIFFITRYLLKIVRVIFENIELGVIRISGFESAWIWPTYKLAKVGVIIFAVIIAYPYIPGSGTTAFQGITILLGIILSFGSSSVVSNLLAGLFVIYRRSVNVGDWIRVNDRVGLVESITVLETVLRSVKNELISIPNSQLLGAEVVNYTRKGETDGILVHTRVGIGYEEPQRKVEAMLLEAVGRTAGLKSDPAPFVLRSALADYAVVYEVNAFPDAIDALPRLESDLHANILDVFSENHVQIMTPSYIADPEVPKIAPIDDAKAVKAT